MPKGNPHPANPAKKGNKRAQKGNEKRSVALQIRCAPGTKAILKEAAQESGQSLSEWMLLAALEKIART